MAALSNKNPGRPRSARIDRAVLQATSELLAERGYAATSIEMIARRAGVGKAAVYRRWSSKEELVVELLSQDVSSAEAVPDLGDAHAELLWLVNDTIRAFSKTPAGGIVKGLASELTRNHRLNRHVIERVVSVRRDEVRMVFERGVARGDLRAEIDVELAHDILIGPVHYHLLLGEKLDKKLGQRVVDAFLRGASSKVLGRGPNGESPTPPLGLRLTSEELRRVRAMNATAAIVMHFGGGDWSRAQIAGLERRFEEMHIEVIAITDAHFDSEQQVADIEAVLAMRPDIMVSLPTDPVATASVYRRALSQGVKLVFMDNVPRGMKPGDDYVGVVSADNFGNGVASAHLMAEALEGDGTVGIVFHEADFFVTQQRYEAFRQTLYENYPGIAIVEEQGVRGPDFETGAEKVTAAMLAKHLGLNGIWAAWDVLAEGVMHAARTAGRDDLTITTVDLGFNVALEIARGGLIFGLGAQRPFEQGMKEAELAAYGLLGKKAPAYVALPSLSVSKANVLDAWESVYHRPPPQELLMAASCDPA